LVSTTSFYTGSGIIIQHLDFDLEDILIYSLDPTNESVNPVLALVFNVRAPQVASGEVHMTFLWAEVYVNGESLDYASFRRAITGAQSVLTAGYANNITVSSTVTELPDKLILYNASNTGEWVFVVRVTVSYRLFDSRAGDDFVLIFSHDGYTAG